MKQTLRKKILNDRKQLNNLEVLNNKIIDKLKILIKNYNKILIYYPISNEPNILDIMNDDSKDYYLPYSLNHNLEVRKLVDLNNLERDECNILSSKIKTNDEIEVAIVPSVAMNYDMYRLGYGKGYYDRFLKNKDIIKIAVVYDQFLIEDKFQDEWDVCFDYIVTETKIIKRK